MKQSDYFLKFKNLSPSIKGYQRANGYTGLKKALTMTPDQIVEKIENAWLLGRGGAGFPTAVK